MKFMSKKNSGFTLIELLVVISIIALLLSIMLPSLQKAKELTRRIVCVSNCRQWATSVVHYSMDNNDEFPAKYAVNAFTGNIVPCENGLSFVYNRYRLNLLDIFIKPYIGEEKYTHCPGSKNPETELSWQEQIEETSWVKLDYCFYVGYLKTPGGYEWGTEEQPGSLLPLKTRHAHSSMAVAGCLVRNSDMNTSGFGYNHPYQYWRTFDMEPPAGQPNAFVDGSASFTPFKELTVLMRAVNTGYQFWWPDYPGFHE